MSLSKQEHPDEDSISALNFLSGHLKIGVTQPRPQVRFDFSQKQWDFGLSEGIKNFFVSHIGKPEDLKLQLQEPIIPEDKEPEKPKEEEEEQEPFEWLALPINLRYKIVHEMPLQTRINLAATSKSQRNLVRRTRVECKLFVIDDVTRRTSHIEYYPDLHWKVFARPGKRFFVNFVCDWHQDIAICFCEERRPLNGISTATKVYWLAPSGNIKKTLIPNADPYELAVQTASHFFKVINGECKRSTVALAGWPYEIFEIPELKKSYTIGSCYDDVESVHRTYDFFEPWSFDVHMEKTTAKYKQPFSVLQVARYGLFGLSRLKEEESKLCDALLDKDLRILILHDSLVSIGKMQEFILKWKAGQISEKFRWWAISTELKFCPHQFREKIDARLVDSVKLITPPKHVPKEGEPHVEEDNFIRTTTYDVLNYENPPRRAILVMRNNLLVFANYRCHPQVDINGLITYRTRLGYNTSQF